MVMLTVSKRQECTIYILYLHFTGAIKIFILLS